MRHRIPLHQNERSGNRAYSGAELGSVELEGRLIMEKTLAAFEKVPFFGKGLGAFSC